MRFLPVAAAAVQFLALGSGCKSPQEIDRIDPPTHVSAFLPRQDLLIRQRNRFPFHYMYMADSTHNYQNVYVAPTDVVSLLKTINWSGIDDKKASQLRREIKSLGEYLTEQLRREFQTVCRRLGMKLVDSPAPPDTLVIEVAITQLIPSGTELSDLKIPVNHFAQDLSLATRQALQGSLCVECRISDASTRKIVIMFADRERGSNDADTGRFLCASARSSLLVVARKTAAIFSGPNVAAMRRDLPAALREADKSENHSSH